MASKKSPPLTLQTPLQYLKGVGPQRASAFSRKGVTTLSDTLYFFPRKYEDRRRLSTPLDLRHLPDGMQVTVVGKIQQQKEVRLRGRKQTMFELIIMGESGDLLTCTWFHTYKGMSERFKPGLWAIFQGSLKKYRGTPQIVHPEVEIVGDKPPQKVTVPVSLHWGRVVPIYSRAEKLSQRFIREIVRLCLDQGGPLLTDVLPANIRDRHNLMDLRSTIEAMHFPSEPLHLETVTSEMIPAPIRRLIFEEFFKFQLVLLLDRSEMKPEPATPVRIKGRLAQELRKNLPYTLTSAQERSIAEVLTDLQRDTASHRIVQGDVGSGKTMVAFFAAAEVMENGLQSALLAPTEILAEQHFANATKYFASTGYEIVLLTGSLNRAERETAKEKIRSGSAKLVIGTHALLQEDVQWKNLSFVIVDEQHRFGVKQRTALKGKATPGLFPHILTMTATPIPRSLALTVFGELDVSTIDELPPGRQEVVTKVLRGSERQRLYDLIHREVAAQRQAYIVYPLVTDSDKEGMDRLRSVDAEFQRLREGPLQGIRIAVVHGQMKTDERTAVMRAFKNREFDVLLSTTVIEVGVDVPNATVMAIENAERFGLSQLHQLRGRVGRGSHKSYCALITDSRPPSAPTSQVDSAEDGVEDESPWIRLHVLERSRNGFEIAEEDLKLRGPGDFFGTQQSGSPTFRLADLTRDAKLLETARSEALLLYQEDPRFERLENQNLARWVKSVLETASLVLKSG